MSVHALYEIMRTRQDEWHEAFLHGTRDTCSKEERAMRSAEIDWMDAAYKESLPFIEAARLKHEAFERLFEQQPCEHSNVRQWIDRIPAVCVTGVGGDDQRLCSRKRARLV